MTEIQSESIRLRPWQLDDAQTLYGYASDETLASLAGFTPHCSVEQSRIIIRETLSNDYTWAVELVSEKKPIGCICLYEGAKSNIGIFPNEAEVGLWIAPKYSGRGYGSEALSNIVEWCRKNTELRSLYADCRCGQDPSYFMLSKCGFAQTDRFNANSLIKPSNEERIRVMKLDLRKWILFLCHGNICRSTMAEFILNDMTKKRGLEQSYHVESAAVSTEEIGNPIYPPAARCLDSHLVWYDPKRVARRVTKRDYDLYDRIICMDRNNLRLLERIIGSDPDGKVHLMMHFSGESKDVADPWYTGDFEVTYRDVNRACRDMIENDLK